MVAKTYKVHFLHASLRIQDPGRPADVRFALSQGADYVSFTETAGIKSEMQEACRDKGYQLVAFAEESGESFCINKDTVKLKNKGSVIGTPKTGPSDARRIVYIQTKFDDETIWFHTCHWLANLADGVQPRQRQQRHNDNTRRMAAIVRKHAKGSDLSFFSGDSNVDDQGGITDYNQIMRSNGLTSIWDEFKVYPNTHGRRTIDIIGSYDPDTRVKGLRYKVWPKQNSDHRPISAWYEIKRAKVKGGGHNGPGTGGDDGTSPEPLAQGENAGNRNWEDYLDGAIYNLPQAVDDSDDPRHGGTISE